MSEFEKWLYAKVPELASPHACIGLNDRWFSVPDAESAFNAGRASRDAEVMGLRMRIAQLQTQLEEDDMYIEGRQANETEVAELQGKLERTDELRRIWAQRTSDLTVENARLEGQIGACGIRELELQERIAELEKELGIE